MRHSRCMNSWKEKRFGVNRRLRGVRRTNPGAAIGAQNRRVLQKLAQRFPQLLPAVAAQDQLGAIAQTHCIVAVKKRREFSYSIKIDDGGTMDAHELSRVQALLN
jgi:hypothetical protein